jgi:hypothetical protein
VQEGNFTEAKRLLARAQTSGVSAQNVESMKRTMDQHATRRYLQLALITLALVMAIGAVGVALRTARRRRLEVAVAGDAPAPGQT